MMTEKQKNTILKMRAEGISFKDIAEELGMSLGSVKMFVSHHNRNYDRSCEPCGELLAKDSVRDFSTIPVHRTNARISGIMPEYRACANCNKPLEPNAKRTQRFCCEKCRNDWWNHHQNQISAQISCQVSCQVSAQISDQISNQVSNQIAGQISGQVSGQASNQVPDRISTSKRTVKVCNVCGKLFATYKAAKYCSRACYLVSVRTE